MNRNDTVSMRWLGPGRELPGYGVAKPGEVKTGIPRAVAESYEGQNLAKIVDKSKGGEK